MEWLLRSFATILNLSLSRRVNVRALEAKMRHKLYALAMALSGMAFVEPAAAQAPAAQAPFTEQTISIGQGIAYRWTSPRAFKDIVQGDDKVVQVTVGPSDREIILVGKETGISNVLIFDPQGAAVADLKIVVGRAFYKTRVYTRSGNLQGYWAYSCTPSGCEKIGDPNEGYERVPPTQAPVNVFQPGSNPQVTPPQPAVRQVGE
jgi:Pilus formation protein N terminal region